MTYRLKRHGRELYEQQIVTDPPIVAWEASFDGGSTWSAGEAVPGDPGWYRWLIAGDLADPGTSVAQIPPTPPGDLVPMARAIANPEIVVRDLEPIRVT
jgi:hypothetical protein